MTLNLHMRMREHVHRGVLSKGHAYIYGGEKPIRVNEGVRVHYRHSMYITDLLIFTITLNQAYGTLCFSPFKNKNHAIAFKRNHLINYF